MKKYKGKNNSNWAMRGMFVFLAFFSTIMWLSETKEPLLIGNHSKVQFIEKISGEAKFLYRKYGVLPSISIAQAILESNWGKSSLAEHNRNYYGIKSGKQDGKPFETKEFLEESGQWVEVEANFRIYDSWQESMEDHARLLFYGTDWNKDLYRDVIEASDYETAAYALQEAGYATDPQYPEKLIRLIEQFDLASYDEFN